MRRFINILKESSEPVIDAYGNRSWFDDNGKLHREDGPANISKHGSKYWFKHGKLHREDGPAVEAIDGSKQWYIDGKLHRLDGPAAINVEGEERWYKDGVLHRDNGPAVVWPDGTKRWYKNGKIHCDDGPAEIDYAGIRRWYLDGEHITFARWINENSSLVERNKKIIMHELLRLLKLSLDGFGYMVDIKSAINILHNILHKIGTDWPELNVVEKYLDK